ncbi:D-alanine--D-alanine ligase family protein [Leifsonia sp. Root112D2]|uniref:D-alanine--D-alanine ligase family protein n=1 Tax=Leifsonia sp. Root112D2 TaxID=1736426 RepID=UPI0006F6D7DC|nr:D-alanine--D-alanine ligase family protein [Leifsonia sp. Root112D2]KQV07672.1 D-alanine--D-alanine ligase [Leifsonia sp. Root112D2]
MTDKLAVVLLFGGRSSEHSISCATAGGVLAAIDRDRYDVIPVGITRDGAFVLERDDAEAFTLNPDALPSVTDNGTRVRWPETATSRELTVREADGTERSLGAVDVIFPILHGPYGEDGTIQGLLELIDLPFVGSGVLASALGMDKHFTKTVLQAAGIEVAPWLTVTSGDWQRGRELWRTRVMGLGLPAFVKPARAGSSVGVSRVDDWNQLDEALAIAFAEDDKVLIEQAIVGREIECGVLQSRDGGAPRVSVAGEVRVTGRDFYDFAAKYLDAPGIELVCPAELNEGELREMQRIAARAFEAIGAEGLARVDFFLTPTGFIVNEVNTMPGFTPISMFPKCWQASGLEYPRLIDELIESALASRGR